MRSQGATIGRVLAVLSAAGVLVSCERENEFVAPPPPKVTVATPVQQDVTSFLEFTGRFEASEDVEIIARVTGFVDEVRFEDGQPVSPGTPMYLIDPREYQAAVETAEAELERTQAEKDLADVELDRFEAAYTKQGVSELEVIEARARVKKWTAQVNAAAAALERARLELSYTEVASPIVGLAGRTLVHPGDLVGSGGATLLTNVVRQDPSICTSRRTSGTFWRRGFDSARRIGSVFGRRRARRSTRCLRTGRSTTTRAGSISSTTVSIVRRGRSVFARRFRIRTVW